MRWDLPLKVLGLTGHSSGVGRQCGPKMFPPFLEATDVFLIFHDLGIQMLVCC